MSRHFSHELLSPSRRGVAILGSGASLPPEPVGVLLEHSPCPRVEARRLLSPVHHEPRSRGPPLRAVNQAVASILIRMPPSSARSATCSRVLGRALVALIAFLCIVTALALALHDDRDSSGRAAAPITAASEIKGPHSAAAAPVDAPSGDELVGSLLIICCCVLLVSVLSMKRQPRRQPHTEVPSNFLGALTTCANNVRPSLHVLSISRT